MEFLNISLFCEHEIRANLFFCLFLPSCCAQLSRSPAHLETVTKPDQTGINTPYEREQKQFSTVEDGEIFGSR